MFLLYQFGADFSVKTPRVFAHRLLQFMARNIPLLNNTNSPKTASLTSDQAQVLWQEESDLTFLSYHSVIEPSARRVDLPDSLSLGVARFCYSDEKLQTEPIRWNTTGHNETL